MTSALKLQFVGEAREQLEQVAKDVMTLERAGASSAVFDSLFRQIHTMKGNCGLFDDMALVGKSLHHAEDQLDKLRESDTFDALPEQLADLLLELLDFVDEVISRFEEGEENLQLDTRLQDISQSLTNRFAQLNNAAGTPADELVDSLVNGDNGSAAALPQWVLDYQAQAPTIKSQGVWVRYCPDAQAFFTGEDPLLNLLNLANLVWSKGIWPPVDEDELIDPFTCRVQLIGLCEAPLHEVQDALRYVLEFCELVEVSAATGEAATPAVDPANQRSALPAPVRQQAQALWNAQVHSLKALMGRSIDDTLLQRQLAVVETVLGNLAKSLGMNSWLTQIDLASQGNCLQDILDTLSELPLELQDDAAQAVIAEVKDSPPSLQPSAVNTENSTSAAVNPAKQVSSTTSATSAQTNRKEVLRVPRERVDRFMDLVGEMVVAKNSLPFLAARAEDEFGSREIAKLIREQYAVVNRIVDEMQDAVMRVRMTPVDAVFQRFPRLVRDLSRQLGKQVELRIRGEDTEADKNMIERLAEPMIHLVRNTMDHGIETPAKRQELGKPTVGTLEITASQDGDRVLIELIDDGAGINREKVAQKVVDKGLLAADKVAQLKPEEIDDLIFLPGFSTADQISAVSGRGVGMDAVRTSIEAMGGDVRLQNEPGAGLRVSISLPLSMAVSRVMVIESGNQQFGLPVEAIVETVRRPGSEFKSLQGAKAIILRNKLIALKSLNEVLDVDQPQQPNEEGEWAILICRVRGQRVGIIIDDFKGTADVIVKPMEGALAGMNHFQGTALLGDGSVLLVLDLLEAFAHDHSM